MIPVKLAESILALHEDILEVYVMDERDGRHLVVEEASRSGASLLADGMILMGRQAPLSPAIILGAADQLLRDKSTKLVGVLYGGGGIVLAPINERRLFVASTTSPSLFSVMQRIEEALPRITLTQEAGSENAVNSAGEAEARAVEFLANRLHGESRIRVDQVESDGVSRSWIVIGYFQSMLRRKRRYEVRVCAKDGTILKYTSSSAAFSNWPLVLETVCLIVGACLGNPH